MVYVALIMAFRLIFTISGFVDYVSLTFVPRLKIGFISAMLDCTISGFAENTPAREKLYLYIDLSVLFIVLNPN